MEYIGSALNFYYEGMFLKDIALHLKETYDYSPSNSLILYWIEKYMNLAVNYFKYFNPQVGSEWLVWVDDAALLGIKSKRKIYIYDVMDKNTRFLLSSQIASVRTISKVENVCRDAATYAKIMPRSIITDIRYPFLNGEKIVVGNKIFLIPDMPYPSDDDVELMERFKVIVKNKNIEVKRSFRNINSLANFLKGWLVHYNYFKPNPSIGNITPAEKSLINCKINNWTELVKLLEKRSGRSLYLPVRKPAAVILPVK